MGTQPAQGYVPAAVRSASVAQAPSVKAAHRGDGIGAATLADRLNIAVTTSLGPRQMRMDSARRHSV